jgi:putative endonuclease
MPAEAARTPALALEFAGYSPPSCAGSTRASTRLPRGGWACILTNRPNGTLYVGVTSDLARRIWEHREGIADGFTTKYSLKRLVWTERHDAIRLAIQREHNIRHWPRAWKVRLILADNPGWDDLYEALP